MCNLDTKGGGNFGKLKLWKGEEAKILCCPSGSSEFQEGFNQFMKTYCMNKKAMLSSKTMGPVNLTPRRTQSSATVLSELKSYIYPTNKEPQRVKLPYVMSSCTWPCFWTLLQQIQSSSL
jgi:hypothetical protein